ncbi:neprilysin-like [Prorops nasuta]|uniref:neprilysin-like n=1 Tax=Prorops nasuta TaxID=863751 RepID=UPI0034CE6B38
MYFMVKLFWWFLIFVLGTIVLGRTVSDLSNDNTNFIDSNLLGLPQYKQHYSKANGHGSKSNLICQSEECNKIGKFILGNMNKSVNPCDDFYEYACGNWKISNPIPNWATSTSSFHLMLKNVRSKVQEILDAKVEPNDILPVKMAKKWYKACMNEKAINDKGLSPIISIVSKIGGWPITMAKNERVMTDDYLKEVEKYYAKSTGFTSLFSYNVIEKGHLGVVQFIPFISIELPTESLEDDIKLPSRELLYSLDSYKKLIMAIANKIAKETGATLDQNKLSKDVDDLVNFEKQLYKIRSIKVKEEEDSRKVFIKAYGIEKVKNINFNAIYNENDDEKRTKDDEDDVFNEISQIGLMKKRHHINYKQKQGFNKKIFKKHRNNNKINKDSETYRNSSHKNFEKNERRFSSIFKKKDYSDENKSNLNDIYETKVISYNKKHDEDFEVTSAEVEKFITEIEELFTECFADVLKNLGVKKNKVMIMVRINTSQRLEYTKLLMKTPNEVIVNYIHWSFINKMLKYTTDDIEDMIFQIWSNIYGVTEKTPRWISCVQSVKFTDAISYEYVRKYFPAENLKIGNEMVDILKTATKLEIEKSNWMNDDIKKFAKEKVDKMKKSIGYPEWYNNNGAVKNYYNGLNINFEHFENALSYQKYEKLQTFEKLLSDKFKPNMWNDFSPITTNAMFSAIFNVLVLPAAIFQSPFFSNFHPDAINFGFVGFIISHELSHAFDPHGRNYDKHGKNFNWDEKMDKEYLAKANCYIKQYNSYSVQVGKVTINVNGENTLNENIADCLGTHNIYKAFKLWRKNKKRPDSKLPGLQDFSEDQLFFLSTASVWCETIKPPKSKQLDLDTDEHSPARIRVLGELSNSEEFSKAFSCPVGSYMNPEKKCNIWK